MILRAPSFLQGVGVARLLSLLCWASFIAFLCVSESFRRFCAEAARLAAKL